MVSSLTMISARQDLVCLPGAVAAKAPEPTAPHPTHYRRPALGCHSTRTSYAARYPLSAISCFAWCMYGVCVYLRLPLLPCWRSTDEASKNIGPQIISGRHQLRRRPYLNKIVAKCAFASARDTSRTQKTLVHPFLLASELELSGMNIQRSTFPSTKALSSFLVEVPARPAVWLCLPTSTHPSCFMIQGLFSVQPALAGCSVPVDPPSPPRSQPSRSLQARTPISDPGDLLVVRSPRKRAP
jgi:hypothetical protein